jgi:hypothetical protein
MINNQITEKAFNNNNSYGYGFNYAEQMERDKSNSVSKGGLNNVNETKKSVKADNPHTNELTNMFGYGYDLHGKTNFQPTIIDKLQYIQPPNLGYNNNRNLGILKSIASTKTKEEKHHVLGQPTGLLIDKRG